jgi:ketosteroid isomerase-like protein
MATDTESMMSDFLAAMNAHDLEKMLTFFTDDAVYDCNFIAGDQGAGEWVMSGTFAQSTTPGVTATGKKFSVRGATINEFRGGKISRNTNYWNLAEFLQQVGLMPSPPQ